MEDKYEYIHIPLAYLQPNISLQHNGQVEGHMQIQEPVYLDLRMDEKEIHEIDARGQVCESFH